MKISFVSALFTIALAVPLGIGGLTIAAPVTATNANSADQLDERKRVVRRKLDAFERECDTPDTRRSPVNRRGARELRSDFIYSDGGNTSVVSDYHRQNLPAGDFICSTIWVVDVAVPSSQVAILGRRNVQRLVESRFRFQPDREDLGLYYLSADGPVAFQVTPVEPLGSLAEIEEIGDHRQATSVNREKIVELQGEVTEQEEKLQELEPAVERNVQVIEALGNSVGVLSQAITTLSEDTEKNTAGIALAYALDAPGLSEGKSFAITGALGQFRGESAVGLSGSFKAGENVLISVGGGFAGSGDSSVTGGKVSVTYVW